jgi:two-component system nitrate/nitrite response regulator NarL
LSARDAHVLVVDDHELFAEALTIALNAAGHPTERLGLPDGASTEPLITKVLNQKPTVLLLDLHLGEHGDGHALIGPATQAGVDVVVVTGSQEPGQWARAIVSGARKVLSKASSLSTVVETVGRLSQGLPVMAASEHGDLLEEWVRQRTGNEELWARFDALTLRESEVLGLLMQGHTVREVARHGNTAEGTVRTQVKSILAKLKVSSQLSAVALAHRIGWQAPFEWPLRR